MKEHKNAHGSVTASGSSLLSSNYKLWKVPRNLLWRFCAPIYSFWRFWVSHWFSDVLLLAAVLNPSALLLTLYFGWAALAQTCFCRSQASGTHVLWTDHEETTKHSLRIIIWGLDWWRVSPHDSRGSFCLILIYNPAVWGLHWRRATCLEGNSKCDRYQIRSLELVEFPVPISAFFVPVAGRHCLSTCWCSWHLRGSGFLREHRMLAEQLQVHSSAQAGPPKRALSSWNPRNTDKFHSEDNIRGYPGDLCPEAVISTCASKKWYMEMRWDAIAGCHKDFSNPSIEDPGICARACWQVKARLVIPSWGLFIFGFMAIDGQNSTKASVVQGKWHLRIPKVNKL